MNDFISIAIFLILMGLLLTGFGIIAEIGIYTYHLKENKSPYMVRSVTLP
jgi:hypothetical protein